MATGFKVAQVNASLVPSTQTSFPSYVDLSRLGITTLAEAQSVRVYADSGKATEWAREIVSATEMHVKVPSLTSTVSMYVDYDGVRANYGNTDTYGRNAVWSDYEMVLHLESGVSDSTGNGHARTAGAGETTGVTGKLGKGTQYSGSSSYTFVNGTFPTGANARTLSAWIKFDITTGNRFAVSYGTDAARQMMGITNNFGGGTIGVTLNSADDNTTVSINTSAFQKVAYKYTGTEAISYVDGVLKTTRTVTANTGSGNFTIGNYPGVTSVPLDGTIDEIRVRKSVVSDDWEETEYNNQSNESSFWGTWTDAGGGATPRGGILLAW
jgi:hypothetical protein